MRKAKALIKLPKARQAGPKRLVIKPGETGERDVLVDVFAEAPHKRTCPRKAYQPYMGSWPPLPDCPQRRDAVEHVAKLERPKDNDPWPLGIDFQVSPRGRGRTEAGSEGKCCARWHRRL